MAEEPNHLPADERARKINRVDMSRYFYRVHDKNNSFSCLAYGKVFFRASLFILPTLIITIVIGIIDIVI